MAINVDKVYRVVLAIMNKEQRGYLTPDQFNRLGRQAQLDLLEKSFYDYNRALTRRNAQGVNSEYGDIAERIEEQIDILTKTGWLDFTSGKASLVTKGDSNEDVVYKIISISTNGTTGTGRTTEVEKVKKSDFVYHNSSIHTSPTQGFPMYYQEGENIVISPTTIQEATIDYVKLPENPTWAYTTGGSGQYLFDSNNSVDFELHASEETNLVIKILALAGVLIKDPLVVQAAQGQETNEFNQQNAQ